MIKDVIFQALHIVNSWWSQEGLRVNKTMGLQDKVDKKGENYSVATIFQKTS